MKILNAPNVVTGDNKMSRAAAFVFAFSVLHSLPNALLLMSEGDKKYDESVKDAHKLKLLPVFEIYLAVSFAVHAALAVKSGVERKRVVLLVTGAVIAGFLVKHVADFRLGDFRHGTPSTELAKVLTDKSEKIMYIFGVLAVGIHTYKGISPGWMFRLGFRGNEIPRLILVGRILNAVTTGLYLAPILLV